MNSWAKKIRDLQRRDMTLSQIAIAIGLATSSVGDIARGRSASPRGDAALKLQALHFERCKDQNSDAHME